MNISKYFFDCERWNLLTTLKSVLNSKEEVTNSYTFAVYENLSEVSVRWELFEAQKKINPWLSLDFQKNVAAEMSENLKLVYGSFSFQNEILGYFPIYIFDFSLNKSLQLRNPVKKYFAKFANARILLMGQLLATGLNFPFHDYLKEVHFQKELNVFLQQVAISFKAKAILWKDFFTKCANLEDNGYFSFIYQPAMIMNVQGKWLTMKDYENSISSKYRVRLQRARKKMKEVIWLNLSEEEIGKWQTNLHKLYTGVVYEAVFNLATVPETYFLKMKNTFKDKYNLVAGFFEGELVCFYSTLINGDTMEANLAGFEENSNLKMQLYLNMLYLMVEDAIKLSCEKINFYRTALEIKSSVGAVGYDSFIYIRPTSKWLAPLLPILIPWFSPKNPTWIPRSPFKVERL